MTIKDGRAVRVGGTVEIANSKYDMAKWRAGEELAIIQLPTTARAILQF